MDITNISKTAFLIAWGRSKFPEISLDPYAKIWLTQEGIEFSEKFSNEITKFSPYFLSLRSRYIVEQLKEFETRNPRFSLINVGSGITSYPFILSDKAVVYELDQQHVLEVRKNQIKAGIENQSLPNRIIHFVPVNLNLESGTKSLQEILDQQTHPTFVLFEGILPYLQKPQALNLINLCAKNLPYGSKVIVHIFLEDYATSKIRKKVVDFFGKELGLSNHSFTYFAQNELEEFPNLQLIEHVGLHEIQKRYAPNNTFDEEELIDERFFLFEKTK